MPEGKLTRVVSEGYGFIRSKRIDYWFHQTMYKGDFKRLLAKFVAAGPEKLDVSFEVDTSSERSPRAKNVVLVDKVSSGK